MTDRPAPAGRPLATILVRRLAWIALAVFVANSAVVGAYYASDRRALGAEVVVSQTELLEEALDGATLPADSGFRDLYAEYPEAYAFALIDRSGAVLDTMNAALIPPSAKDIYADDWVTRVDRPGTPLFVAGHEFDGREDGLRLVFVMADDPARLIWRAYLDELYEHVWLPILPLVLLLLGAGTLVIRRGLAPVAAAAAWARDIRPGRRTPPPPSDPLPAEIADLVDATQRSLDRLSDALAAEKRRAAEAAHALRTPVAVLVARVDALPPGETTDRLRADLAALSRTVQQVLASGRADGLVVPRRAALDLRDPAETVVAALAPFAHRKGVELSLSLPDAPVPARADAEGVELALTNLVENAVLHGGGTRVEITVGPGPELTVWDDGTGLPPDAGPRLFEPFWRGDGAAPGGTGLGLAIVTRLQDAQGGTVEDGDASEGGALFRLTYRAA
ncbi:sensor histidine kinase [Jannaschia aquimarina]|uniref:histidine kinase n=1 Tax=Jannaschia aquimarina TaxID=935700 RepID=A0A0D1D3B9_9RHOB|nr:HAMP domain-containing sensor histidine kinase [Jannaschia aquimarina]KIT14613.1 Sensor protein QseC [Jannaschia aquimarina]SNS77542.1 two-component system, OmpR family, sensor kinase [Jannaschia aquimarina]